MLKTGLPSFDAVFGGLTQSGINTVLCVDQSSKSAFTSKVVSSALRNKVVSYIDLDTAFSAYLRAGFITVQGTENLLLYTPEGKNIEKAVIQVCSVRHPTLGLLVFDSVTTFYHLFSDTADFGDLNRRIGLYLSMFQSLASRLNVAIVVISMLRAKKAVKSGVESWFPSASGGRVLAKSSTLIISLNEQHQKLRITMMKHPRSELVGTFVEEPLT